MAAANTASLEQEILKVKQEIMDKKEEIDREKKKTQTRQQEERIATLQHDWRLLMAKETALMARETALRQEETALRQEATALRHESNLKLEIQLLQLRQDGSKVKAPYVVFRDEFHNLCKETELDRLENGANELWSGLQLFVEAGWGARDKAQKAEFDGLYRNKDACAPGRAADAEESFDAESVASDDTNTSNPEARAGWLPPPLKKGHFKFSEVTFSEFAANGIPCTIVDGVETDGNGALEKLRVCATLLIEAKYLEATQGQVREGTINERVVQLLVYDWLQAAARVHGLPDVELFDTFKTKAGLMLCISEEDRCFGRGFADIMGRMESLLRFSVEVKPHLCRPSYLAEAYMQCLALSAANVTKAYPDLAAHSWNIEELDKVELRGFRAPGLLFTLFKLHILVPKGSRGYYHQVVPEGSIVGCLIGLLKMLADSDQQRTDPGLAKSCLVDSAVARLSLESGAVTQAGGEEDEHAAEVRQLLSTPRARQRRGKRDTTQEDDSKQGDDGENHDEDQEDFGSDEKGDQLPDSNADNWPSIGPRDLGGAFGSVSLNVGGDPTDTLLPRNSGIALSALKGPWLYPRECSSDKSLILSRFLSSHGGSSPV